MRNPNHSRTLAARLFAAALLLLTAAIALADVHYVDVNGTNATPPYTNWTTAATNIQDAVDAAMAGEEVMVTNGIYARVSVGKALTIMSVNGPPFTTISGGGPCVDLASNASLSGFTVTGGNGFSGGGVSGGTLYNCTLSGNSADDGYGGGAAFATLNSCTLSNNSASGGFGGGTYSCTLNNCTLTGNYAGVDGGGAYGCTLNSCTLTGNSASYNGGGAAFCWPINNCTLTGNSAGYGGGAVGCTLNNCTLTGNGAFDSGGAYGCTLNNCILYFNLSAYFNPNGGNYSYGALNYCCTTPQPDSYRGIGNLTNAPLFVDTNGWANLRLQAKSPCINAGNNSYVTGATDLDGNPRISGGIVDIGAYEFQWPQLTITPSGPNVLLTWPTNNAGYDYTGFTLQSATNLVSRVWSTNSPAPVVIGGQNTVTNPITGPQQFYRLVQ